MIRDSIARHVGAAPRPDAPMHAHTHPSFARLPLVSGDPDGMCVIEPTVRCNHCGYCLSYGH